jgi:hypothetical protein
MELLSFLSIAAGALGVLASALATYFSAASKVHLKIKVAGVELTLTSDNKEISPADIAKLEAVLRDLARLIHDGTGNGGGSSISV